MLVDIGKLEAILPVQEQVPGEDYAHGLRLRTTCVRVAKGVRGPSVTLSRTHPNLVKKLFALEVPEIADGSVVIEAIAREAGHRTQDRRTVHPLRAQRQGRLHRPDGQPGAQRHGRAARREDRHRGLVGRPGRDGGQRPLAGPGEQGRDRRPGARSARVTVPDYQLSLAIGKEGQNARLAARLTGWRIDIRPDTEQAPDGAPDQD